MIVAKNHCVHDPKFTPKLHSWIFFLLVRFDLDLLENFAQRRREVTYRDKLYAKFEAMIPSTNGMESTEALIALSYAPTGPTAATAFLNLMSMLIQYDQGVEDIPECSFALEC
jgi:hypothetical protein